MAYILQQLLSNSASLYPTKTAVSARGRNLSYRELEERSNQLAHLLLHCGVKKGDRVGLFFPKCVESLVCMLGALKAGAVYVPLDPQAPAERIAYIMGDCGVRVLLTNAEKRKVLDGKTLHALDACILTDNSAGELNGSRVLPWSMLADYPSDQAPQVTITETDLAYILYTSGSTGRPKGVMLSHRNALQCAGIVEGPAVVGAPERVGVSLLGIAQLVGAVRATVEHDADHAVLAYFDRLHRVHRNRLALIEHVADRIARGRLQLIRFGNPKIAIPCEHRA